jgi:hypothetical protein
MFYLIQLIINDLLNLFYIFDKFHKIFLFLVFQSNFLNFRLIKYFSFYYKLKFEVLIYVLFYLIYIFEF